MKILILGGTGLLGYECLKSLSSKSNLIVKATVRKKNDRKFFQKEIWKNLIIVKNLLNINELNKIIMKEKPRVILNCLSLDKKKLNNYDESIKLLSLFPKKLDLICSKINCRLILISSDGVFSGEKGNYSEKDIPDAADIYGISKYLGEITFNKNLVIRTSIIGHQITKKDGLLEWFLSQKGSCEGHTRSFFSGLTNIELSKILTKIIVNHKNLSGIINISSQPISKYDLLCKVNKVYEKNIKILKNNNIRLNRSLNSSFLFKKINYKAPVWDEMIREMYDQKNR